MPFVKPTNKVLVGGAPVIEELEAEGTTIKPRLLVVKGTADHQVGLAGAGAVNVQGIVKEDPRTNIDTAFADGDPVSVIKGPALVVGILAESQTITKGDKLIAAANGEVQSYPATPAAGDEEKIVAIAEETISTGAGETKNILMRLVM